MEIVVLCGVPGSGKSTLARTRFANHTRVNLDTLRSRTKEDQLIREALKNGESLVIDNTNTTRRARRRYIEYGASASIPVKAVCLICPLELALNRNASRKGTKEFVPEKAIFHYYDIFDPPSKDEGFESVEFVLEHS